MNSNVETIKPIYITAIELYFHVVMFSYPAVKVNFNFCFRGWNPSVKTIDTQAIE